MVSQETAAAIWSAYREIAAAEKLLTDLAEEQRRASLDKHAPTLKDAFGHRRHLQLGVPTGESAHRLFDVRPTLADSVIRAHIGNQRAALAEANERARVELAADVRPPVAGDRNEAAPKVVGELCMSIVDDLDLPQKAYERYLENLQNTPARDDWWEISSEKRAAWRAAVLVAVEAALRHAGVV